MKTIKLYVKPTGAKERGGRYNRFDLEKYSKAKFYTKDEIISIIARKLKQPINEVKKQKTFVDKAFKQMRELFLEKTIIEKVSYKISFIEFFNKIPQKTIDINNTIAYHQVSYNEDTNTINAFINYEGCIKHHKELSKFRYHDLHKNNKQGYKEWCEHTNQLHNYKKYPNGNIPFMEDNVIPKYVRHWCTKIGKDEINFISENLNCKKIKLEIYSKSKKLNTYYINFNTDKNKLI